MSETRFCDICQCKVPGGGWEIHISGRAHCRKVGTGVSVTPDTELDFGVVDPSVVLRVVNSFVLSVTIRTVEVVVLDPQWTSSSLRETACVIPALRKRVTSPNSLTFLAASRVESKANPVLGKVAPFGSLWACASPKSVDMKIRWRLYFVYPKPNSFP